jgi:hypothetical protein
MSTISNSNPSTRLHLPPDHPLCKERENIIKSYEATQQEWAEYAVSNSETWVDERSEGREAYQAECRRFLTDFAAITTKIALTERGFPVATNEEEIQAKMAATLEKLAGTAGTSLAVGSKKGHKKTTKKEAKPSRTSPDGAVCKPRNNRPKKVRPVAQQEGQVVGLRRSQRARKPTQKALELKQKIGG